MFFLYSILLAIGFMLMSPLFLLRREKYASGFRQRLGNYPEFKHDDRKVIWLHCVSVGETNAARPLVASLREYFPDHRLVISTTTRTGQDLACKLFADQADAIIYFPFDFKFSVRRALEHFKPSLVLLMETEIWPRFIREASCSGSGVAIINGRLSERSFRRYARVRTFVGRVLKDVDLALMQNEADAGRIRDLGIDPGKVFVTGNLKFEQSESESENALTENLRSRFAVTPDKPLVIAASTHDPEERLVIEALGESLGYSCRLMVAPRHPERFDSVAKLLADRGRTFVRRTDPLSDSDRNADVILLDSIGELRAAYPLAEIVFVGGSLIPHGGQSILEPAAVGRAIITGPHTHNFAQVVSSFKAKKAIIQIEEETGLKNAFEMLLGTKHLRNSLGNNALAAMESSGEASKQIVSLLQGIVE